MGGERVCLSASYRGIEACVMIDPRSRLVAIGLRLALGSSLLCKTVVICLLAGGINLRCTSALRWPKIARASLDLSWTRRLRATLLQHPQLSPHRAPAPVPLKGFFSPSTPTSPLSHPCASATTPAPRPPLGAPRMHLPPPHLFVTHATRLRLDAPHPPHIHHRLPSGAPRTLHSALPQQERRAGRTWVTSARSSREDSMPTMSSRARATMTRDVDMCGVRASIYFSSSTSAAKAPRSSPVGAAEVRGRGCGRAAAAPREDDEERGDALLCPLSSLSSSSAAYPKTPARRGAYPRTPRSPQPPRRVWCGRRTHFVRCAP
jgi:hypothetical protein